MSDQAFKTADLQARLIESCRKHALADLEEVLSEAANNKERRNLVRKNKGKALRVALPQGGEARLHDGLQETNEAVEVVRAIILAGGDPNDKGCNIRPGICNCTPFIFASFFGLEKIIEVMVDKAGGS